MMRAMLSIAGAAVVMSACASSTSSTAAKPGDAPAAAPAPKAPAPRQPVTDNPNVRRAIVSDNTGIMYSDAPLDQSRVIAAKPEFVMNAIRQAYDGFMIPITLDDRQTRRIGNPDFQRSRQFMGKRMVELLDCGGGITGPNALTYRIYMSLVTRVKDAPNGQSEVSVQLLATGKDLASGASSDRIPCGSSGKMEQRLLDEIEKRVGTKP